MSDNTPDTGTTRWQPIETAPTASHDYVLVYWNSGSMSMEDACDPSEANWLKSKGATHWMPLPEPPSNSGSQP